MIEWPFDFPSGAQGYSNDHQSRPLHRWEIAFTVVENARWDYMAGFSFTALDETGRVVVQAAEQGNSDNGRLPPFRRLAEGCVTAAREQRACQPDFAAGARVLSLIAMLRG
jgi:hypothetical protein